ncbi:MAG: DoxX family protein [Bdellovibrionaceae bacterium]|nr:DoxX family protein [Pseudobdellovibrionaceae bacterium]
MSKIKNYFKVLAQPNFASIALLILRLVVGLAFMYHGWGKIQNPFGWMPAGAPVPGFFQALAAISEFGGGIALILGLLVPLASLGLICTMAVAVVTHAFVMKDPFVNMTGGTSFEPALGYLAIAIVFLAVGPGNLSADAKIFGQRTQ